MLFFNNVRAIILTSKVVELKEVFVNNSLNYLKKNNACDPKQEKIFKYTLESLYSFFTKSFVILLLAFILNTFKITFVTLILYSVLRGFTFGIHATKNIYCWIISLTFYIFLPIIIKYLTFPTYLIYISYILGIIAIVLWAPSDTKARPLISKKKRIFNKLIALLISSILIILTIFIDNQNLKEIISVILLLNLICTNPITYYIFKQPYKNYRFYKSK